MRICPFHMRAFICGGGLYARLCAAAWACAARHADGHAAGWFSCAYGHAARFLRFICTPPPLHMQRGAVRGVLFTICPCGSFKNCALGCTFFCTDNASCTSLSLLQPIATLNAGNDARPPAFYILPQSAFCVFKYFLRRC